MVNEKDNKNIACVIGGSGMVGSRVVDLLLKQGYSVRVLSRGQNYKRQDVEVIIGSLENEEVLNNFLYGASLLFHCAGEFQDESKMWEVNVHGTERLTQQAAQSGISYFCYISSAGVVGKTSLSLVDETTPCAPMNLYEKSKLAAEQLIQRNIRNCRAIILRPTNIVDDMRPGALSLPMKGSFSDRVKVLLKGGECAHIVHAEDVAAAALFFVGKHIEGTECFFVSCDEEPLNTYAGIWPLYKACEDGLSAEAVRPALHVPLIVPYILRRLWRGHSNRGDVRYSSKKLMSAGFVFPLGLRKAIKKVASSKVAAG